MAHRESIEAVLKVKDAARYKAEMSAAAKATDKFAKAETKATTASEILIRVEKKLDRQTAELAGVLTLLAERLDEVGDEAIQTAVKNEFLNRSMKKSGSNAIFLGKSWAFWKDRLSLTRSEIFTTAITISAYFTPAIIAMGSSFANAALGGGAVAGAGLASLIFGLITLGSVIKPVIDDIKKIQKAQEQYNLAIEQYGAASHQASRANAHLGAVIRQNGGQPAARAAQSIQRLTTAWKDITAPARGDLLSSMSEGLGTLQNMLPGIGAATNQMAKALRTALSSAFQDLGSGETGKTFKVLGDTFSKAIGPGVKGATNMIVILGRVVRAAAPYVVKWAEAWEATTTRWRQSTNDQKGLSRFIKNAVTSFKLWWGFAKQLGRTLKIIFGASKDEGDKYVKTLTDLLTKFNDWLQLQKDTGAIDRFWKKYENSLKDILWAIQNPVAAIKKWLPQMMDAVATTLATHAPEAAGLFLRAFLDSGPWAQLLTVAWFLKKFGFFRKLGEEVGKIFIGPFFKAFMERFAPRLMASAGAEGAMGRAAATAGSTAGGLFGAAFAGVAIVLVGKALNDWVTKQPWYKKFIEEADKKTKGEGKVKTFLQGITPGDPLQTAKSIGKSFQDMADLFNSIPGPLGKKKAMGGTIPPGGASIVGDSGPEIASNFGGRTQIMPLASPIMDLPDISSKMHLSIYTSVQVDRREIARAVDEQKLYNQARRGEIT